MPIKHSSSSSDRSSPKGTSRPYQRQTKRHASSSDQQNASSSSSSVSVSSSSSRSRSASRSIRKASPPARHSKRSSSPNRHPRARPPHLYRRPLPRDSFGPFRARDSPIPRRPYNGRHDSPYRGHARAPPHGRGRNASQYHRGDTRRFPEHKGHTMKPGTWKHDHSSGNSPVTQSQQKNYKYSDVSSRKEPPVDTSSPKAPVEGIGAPPPFRVEGSAEDAMNDVEDVPMKNSDDTSNAQLSARNQDEAKIENGHPVLSGNTLTADVKRKEFGFGPDRNAKLGSLLVVDRSTVPPFLLRVFLKINGEHDLSDFATRGKEPVADELQLYAWMDAKLRELVNLVKDICEEARERNAFWRFRLIYPDRQGRNVMAEIGTVHSSRIDPREDNKTLQQSKFQIGDYLDLSISTRKRHVNAAGVAPTPGKEETPIEKENSVAGEPVENEVLLNEKYEKQNDSHEDTEMPEASVIEAA